MAYIEFHQELRSHRKTRRLARNLDIPRAHALGLLAALWSWSLDGAPSGDLSQEDPEGVAEAALWEGDPEKLVQAMQESGWLDGMKIHDWDFYAGRILAKRRARADYQQRYRKDHVPTTNDPVDPPPDADPALRNSDVTPTYELRNSDVAPECAPSVALPERSVAERSVAKETTAPDAGAPGTAGAAQKVEESEPPKKPRAPSISDEGRKLVEFIDRRARAFCPDLPKLQLDRDTCIIANTLVKEHGPPRLRYAVHWAFSDAFWRGQITNIKALTHKSNLSQILSKSATSWTELKDMPEYWDYE